MTPVARVDRTAASVLTLNGQDLPVTDWADRDGVVGAAAADAPVCSAGPDAYGKHWTVDVDRLVARSIR